MCHTHIVVQFSFSIWEAEGVCCILMCPPAAVLSDLPWKDVFTTLHAKRHFLLTFYYRDGRVQTCIDNQACVLFLFLHFYAADMCWASFFSISKRPTFVFMDLLLFYIFLFYSIFNQFCFKSTLLQITVACWWFKMTSLWKIRDRIAFLFTLDQLKSFLQTEYNA